ncbi:Cytoplasmic protein [Salmonella bongori]
MQFSTTPTLEGQSIVEYCGVVTGEAILGANIIGAWSDARRVALYPCIHIVDCLLEFFNQSNGFRP